MADTLFQADAVWRSFRRGQDVLAAVAGVSLRVKAGDRIAVVGPSGSGKTTLLNLMAGLDAPSAGQVLWPALGPAEGLRPAKIGVVFQAQSLMPALTCVENVELPVLLAGDGRGARVKAEAALAIFGVEDLAGKLPEELSGGQAQRVAAARAIATQPRLVLADEPTGQLDRANSALLIDQLLAWLDASAGTLVVATHDDGVAARMNRIWRLNHGCLDLQAQAA
jgi:putative ABC transport system ATP-binding protein/lipoprotein-releasing system ATP-binding protein